MRNATPPCLDTFCRLDRLGLSVTAQHVEPDHTVLRCRPTTPPPPCPGCARPGVRHDAVLRRLVHVPLGWKPTILEVVVPRYRCWPCRRIWRHSITAAAPSKGKLSRDAIMLAVKSIVVDRMSIARVAANLGVAWNTASDAILAAGAELLVDSADRLDGVTTVGVDEHVWRHTRNGDNLRHRHHRPDPDKDQNRPITPSGRGRGPLEADDRCLGSKPRPRRSGTESRSSRWTGSPATRPPWSKRSTPSPP